jgi:hypothetical protein
VPVRSVLAEYRNEPEQLRMPGRVRDLLRRVGWAAGADDPDRVAGAKPRRLENGSDG